MSNGKKNEERLELYERIKDALSHGWRGFLYPMEELDDFCEKQHYSVTDTIRLAAELSTSTVFSLDDDFFIKEGDTFLSFPDKADAVLEYLEAHPKYLDSLESYTLQEQDIDMDR